MTCSVPHSSDGSVLQRCDVTVTWTGAARQTGIGTIDTGATPTKKNIDDYKTDSRKDKTMFASFTLRLCGYEKSCGIQRQCRAPCWSAKARHRNASLISQINLSHDMSGTFRFSGTGSPAK